jgi:hypothetical protein
MEIYWNDLPGDYGTHDGSLSAGDFPGTGIGSTTLLEPMSCAGSPLVYTLLTSKWTAAAEGEWRKIGSPELAGIKPTRQSGGCDSDHDKVWHGGV